MQCFHHTPGEHIYNGLFLNSLFCSIRRLSLHKNRTVLVLYYQYTIKCFSMVMILICLGNSMVNVNMCVWGGVSVCGCMHMCMYFTEVCGFYLF